MLFLAAGIATAWTLRQDRLQVFENGIGAINSQRPPVPNRCPRDDGDQSSAHPKSPACGRPGTCCSLERSFELQVMRWQETRLHDCLKQPDPWNGLIVEFPEVLDTAPLTPTEVVGLYRSYVQEWEDLPEAFRPQIGRTAAL
jgi:hypothetical protein